MIDGEILHQRQVETGMNGVLADMSCKLLMRRDGLDADPARLVAWAGERVVDADRENRQVVEEEGVEVIRIEDDDHVGPGGSEQVARQREQPACLARPRLPPPP